jgi:lysophospholipase L1-like esterase
VGLKLRSYTPASASVALSSVALSSVALSSVALLALLSGCAPAPAPATSATASTPATATIAAKPSAAVGTAPEYYLSLGDSLAVGVQPDARGASLPTGHGYPDQLQALLRGHGQVLSLVKLGCPGETTKTLLGGGSCGYSGEQRNALTGGGGSQLAAALGFLRAHRGHVPLITIDIGANDLAPCVELTAVAAAVACAESAIATVKRNTVTILAALRAADPRAMIAGMTYYAPQLAEWLSGATGRAYAVGVLPLVAAGNAALTADFQAAHARVADVFTAFKGTDLSGESTLPGSGTVPTAVARICEWTWACAAPPVGPNAHANTAGYGVIAATFYAVLRG